MDKDGDGLLSVRELQAGLEARGVCMDDRNAKVGHVTQAVRSSA